jgi:hypothetical protein
LGKASTTLAAAADLEFAVLYLSLLANAAV